MAIRFLPLKFIDKTFDAANDHIVTEIEHEWLILDEILGYFHHMRETKRRFLRNIRNFQSPLRTVFYCFLHFNAFSICDNTDFFNAGLSNKFKCVIKYRLICYRDKMFILCMSQRTQPRAFTSACNESFHLFVSPASLFVMFLGINLLKIYYRRDALSIALLASTSARLFCARGICTISYSESPAIRSLHF